MKRVQFIILSCLFAPTVFSAADNGVISFSLPKADKPVLSVFQGDSPVTRVENLAAYAYPQGLSCLGTFSSENEPVCNYLSPNRLTNKNYFLWAPSGKPVTYISLSLIHISEPTRPY